LIFTKISKIGATRRQVLKLKCTNFDFRFLLGELIALHMPLAVFKGAYF